MDSVTEIHHGYQVERYLSELGEWWAIDPSGPQYADKQAAMDAARTSRPGFSYRIVEVVTTRRVVRVLEADLPEGAEER